MGGGGTDIVLCGYRIYYEAENKYHDRYIKLKNEPKSPRDYLPLWFVGKTIPSNFTEAIFRKKFLDDNSLYFHEGCHVGEDEEFLAKALCASQRTLFVNELLYIVRIHAARPDDSFKPQRSNYDWLDNELPPRQRAVRFILRHSENERERNYAVSVYLAWAIVRQFTFCAKLKDRERYQKYSRRLKHKKIREILFSSLKFVLQAPELAFKSLLLLFSPKFYYVVRAV